MRVFIAFVFVLSLCSPVSGECSITHDNAFSSAWVDTRFAVYPLDGESVKVEWLDAAGTAAFTKYVVSSGPFPVLAGQWLESFSGSIRISGDGTFLVSDAVWINRQSGAVYYLFEPSPYTLCFS